VSRPAPRRAVVAAAVVGCVAAAAVPAFAATAPSPGLTGSPSSTVVSLSSTGVGGRQLSLLDLAGNPLTSVALRPGVPSPFRVKVSDTSVGQLDLGGASFSVSAVLNNL
jgi:hypothetical protein